jgi:hypothetical protein
MNVRIDKVGNGYIVHCDSEQYIAKDVSEIRDITNRHVIVPLISMADNNKSSSNYRGSVDNEG